MITENDLQEAIAECLGQRNPNANTCIKLAAFYIIRKEMFDSPEPIQLPAYSGAGPVEEVETHVDYTSDSEFSQAINGMKASRAWKIMDELVGTLAILHPRLYEGVMREVEEG